MQHPAPSKPQQGFTLLELMITVAIAAILLAIAIPSFQATIANAQLTTQTNNFIAAIASARNEAIKNNARVTLCTSTSATTANPLCTISNWDAGWIVFIDVPPRVTPPQRGVGDTVTTVGQAANGLTIRGVAPFVNSITFQPDGTLVGTEGVVGICKATTAVAENKRNISIGVSGQARVTRLNTAGVCP